MEFFIPKDILKIIFSFCPSGKDLVGYRTVCKSWRQAVSEIKCLRPDFPFSNWKIFDHAIQGWKLGQFSQSSISDYYVNESLVYKIIYTKGFGFLLFLKERRTSAARSKLKFSLAVSYFAIFAHRNSYQPSCMIIIFPPLTLVQGLNFCNSQLQSSRKKDSKLQI